MAYERDFPPLAAPEPRWRERLRQYWALVRGDRPIGWLLLLWPTWWGLWLAAKGVPPIWPLIVFSLGVWLTRSAGCVINDYADRWLDGSVERTRNRPLATGAVSGREALLVFAALMLVAFALVLTLNRLTILMSVVGYVLEEEAHRDFEDVGDRLEAGRADPAHALLVLLHLLECDP